MTAAMKKYLQAGHEGKRQQQQHSSQFLTFPDPTVYDFGNQEKCKEHTCQKTMATQYDIVIQNADILTFEPDAVLKNHHVGIRDGLIAEITAHPIEGIQTIDGTGKMIVPGFIDFHSHVDGKLFSAKCLLRQGATTTIGGERNFDGSTIRKIAEDGFLINHGFYISHSFTLRKAAGIENPYREASQSEIHSMVGLAEEFLESGAFGIHFGLEFAPGTTTSEIVASGESRPKT